MSQLIANNSTPSVTIGGRNITDLANLILLVGGVSGANYTSLRKPESSSGYQVPASKVFRILAMEVTVTTAVAGGAHILYADNDIGLSQAGPPTNPVYPGATTTSQNGIVASTATAGKIEIPLRWDIPTGKYILARSDGAAFTVNRVWGVEV